MMSPCPLTISATKPRPRRAAPAWLALALAWVAVPGAALAQNVLLSGVLGHKALLVIDGGAPRALGVGQELQGVRVIAVEPDRAQVQVGTQQRTLYLGEAPVRVGPAPGRRVVLQPDSRGHFIERGSINGKAVQFMVDTGASTIAISRTDADRMGLNYKNGAHVQIGTANGTTQGWRVKLESVRLGEVEVSGLDAVITPQAMPFVLLGNNFLSTFHMTRTGEQMVLERR